MTDVLDAPRIPSVHNGTWTVRMDGMYVNGRFLSGGSRAAAQYEGASAARRRDDRLVASLDTGSSYSASLSVRLRRRCLSERPYRFSPRLEGLR